MTTDNTEMLVKALTLARKLIVHGLPDDWNEYVADLATIDAALALQSTAGARATPMDKAMNLTLIGFPEDVLRRAAAGILLEEGEVSQELAMTLVDGSLPIHNPHGTDGRVMRAMRKVSSVVLTLRSHEMLKESPTLPGESGMRDLVREVIGEDGEFIGLEGARHGVELCSRLAESGWFKRARAALSQSSKPPDALEELRAWANYHKSPPHAGTDMREVWPEILLACLDGESPQQVMEAVEFYKANSDQSSKPPPAAVPSDEEILLHELARRMVKP